MNILALDLGTRTGWALLEQGRLESGVETFRPTRHESPGMRYVAFNRWLDELLVRPVAAPVGGDGAGGAAPVRVSLIVCERPLGRFVKGGAAGDIAIGLLTRVEEFCARWGLEHSSVPATTLKKSTTGRGNADKAAVLESVARRWRRVDDDNEADAVALLHYALEEIVPRGEGAGPASPPEAAADSRGARMTIPRPLSDPGVAPGSRRPPGERGP